VRFAFLLLLLLATSLAAEPPTGFTGALAVRGDAVVAAENADRLFTPASLTKVLTAAALLDVLGPDDRIKTEVATHGGRAGALVHGDLVVVAAGDPTWNERFARDGQHGLDRLVQAVVAAGIRRVEGDLVIDRSAFPGNGAPPSRAVSEIPLGYGAPTSALALDENTVAVEIAPGKVVGAPARARFLGPSHGILLDNHMITVGPDRHEKGTVELQPVWSGDKIFLRGEYPISEPPYKLQVSLPDPDATAARPSRRSNRSRPTARLWLFSSIRTSRAATNSKSSTA
jgi:D-alanyl-D-alanine carboxypeptidase/D-alanyl-D-alanine-endopeptidase (penicillin-binding protein 4)